MTQPLVFVCYASNDNPEKNQLLTQLRAVPGITVWSDDQIGAGADWEAEIYQAISWADVAILLITASFLGSDFITKKIVPYILNRQAAEGLPVLPVIAKHCFWQATDWLRMAQVRPNSKQPVWGGDSRFVDEALAAIVAEVATIVTNSKLPVPGRADHPIEEKAGLDFEPETILIPAGSFLMSSQPGEDVSKWEMPQHALELPAYRIGKFPVTNEQYARFVEHDPERRPRKVDWRFVRPQQETFKHPVAGISWYDAVAYCNWLSQKSGRSYRLLTEAEWEKAARGPSDGRKYPWGDTLTPDHCNYQSDQTTPVDQYEAGRSPYGCYDMIGNIWEWTSTLWGEPHQAAQFSYPYRPDARENLDAPATIHRIYRGGAYNERADTLGCSVRRYYVAPNARDKNLGFRVALDIVSVRQ